MSGNIWGGASANKTAQSSKFVMPETSHDMREPDYYTRDQETGVLIGMYGDPAALGKSLESHDQEDWEQAATKGPFSNAKFEAEEEQKPKWHDGKKTHLTSIASAIFGVVALSGIIPNVPPEQGVTIFKDMVETSAWLSGARFLVVPAVNILGKLIRSKIG